MPDGPSRSWRRRDRSKGRAVYAPLGFSPDEAPDTPPGELRALVGPVDRMEERHAASHEAKRALRGLAPEQHATLIRRDPG